MAPRRPYRINVCRPQPVVPSNQTAWPDLDTFESDLMNGAVSGKHWPASLPDIVPTPAHGQRRPRRYLLRYVWNPDLPILGVISCNPSQASRRKLDPTLLITVNQAHLWGFGGIEQCNLCPVYEPDSSLLHSTLVLTDIRNWAAIRRVLAKHTIWLAWGRAPSGCTGQLRTDWNAAENCLLKMALARQRRGARLIVTNVGSGGGYRPPWHPRPQRKTRQLYMSPLSIQISDVRK